MEHVPLTTCRPVSTSFSASGLQLTWYHAPHLGHFRSLCRPSSVGAIEPVGITNASATKPRNNRAKITAMATDSTVSRQPPSGGAGFSSAPGFLESFADLSLFMWRNLKHQAPNL